MALATLGPDNMARQPYRDPGAASAIHPGNGFRVHDANLPVQAAKVQYRK